MPVEAGKAEIPAPTGMASGAGRVETIDSTVNVCPCLSERTALVPVEAGKAEIPAQPGRAIGLGRVETIHRRRKACGYRSSVLPGRKNSVFVKRAPVLQEALRKRVVKRMLLAQHHASGEACYGFKRQPPCARIGMKL